MDANADRLAFAPPEQPGLVSGFALAVIAHVLLMIALTWGITWNRETENLSVEAELWSSTPQQAAPRLIEAPPPAPVPAPAPAPAPAPPVTRKVEAAPPPPAPVAREPDIALEREKKKQLLAKQRQEDLERQRKLDARQKLEEQKREQLAAKREEQERRKKEELAKAEKAAKAAQAAKAAKAEKAERQERENEKRVAALRAEQMRRIQGMAGATGSPTATGAAERSAGPSDSYAGRVRARVRPNIVFTDDIAGNPTAEVEVRLSPDGTITSRRVLKSSGVKSWDDAVLRALDKTEVLPRDVDGRVPPHLIIEFKPRS